MDRITRREEILLLTNQINIITNILADSMVGYSLVEDVNKDDYVSNINSELEDSVNSLNRVMQSLAETANSIDAVTEVDAKLSLPVFQYFNKLVRNETLCI